MTTLAFTCPDCGEAGEKRIGQDPSPRRVEWFGSFACARCGAVYEEDGWGELPSGWREALIAQEGEWELRVQPVRTGIVLKVLRAALGLTLVELGQLKERLPGAPCVGTRAEMEHLRLRLAEAGETAKVVSVEQA